MRGCGSPVVKVSDHGSHVRISSPVPLKTCRVGQRSTLNLFRAETPSRWCGVVVRREGASSAARELLVTDLIICNQGQVTWATPELASPSPNFHTNERTFESPEALDLPRSTVQKITRNILGYYPYKLQLMQELLPHDFKNRHLFALQFLARLEVDPEWPWNILWTDRAHIHFYGSVNTHNCRVWESGNPHPTLQVPLH
ncbi:uncharacterized protein TNCV_1686921 [Trichonephila clavipes]|nr:uncharacterized protein TNCV_1686921 [Trichonephila clavipes]